MNKKEFFALGFIVLGIILIFSSNSFTITGNAIFDSEYFNMDSLLGLIFIVFGIGIFLYKTKGLERTVFMISHPHEEEFKKKQKERARINKMVDEITVKNKAIIEEYQNKKPKLIERFFKTPEQITRKEFNKNYMKEYGVTLGNDSAKYINQMREIRKKPNMTTQEKNLKEDIEKFKKWYNKENLVENQKEINDDLASYFYKYDDETRKIYENFDELVEEGKNLMEKNKGKLKESMKKNTVYVELALLNRYVKKREVDQLKKYKFHKVDSSIDRLGLKEVNTVDSKIINKFKNLSGRGTYRYIFDLKGNYKGVAKHDKSGQRGMKYEWVS